jgi:hypothetical protein
MKLIFNLNMKFSIINKAVFISLIINSLIINSNAQQLTQTFRGRVVDAYTEISLPGATVIILGTDPLKGTATDGNGEFRIDGLPLGRLNVQVSMVGYQPAVLNNLLLRSGRELVMEVKLEEQVYVMDDVVIRPELRKDQAINEMAVVSARSFTIDETERYAGSLGDPSRMAANFAGVTSVSDQRNDIVIRGNSPLGLLWRLEGVEIPNPNHFGSIGTTGGPISMLNINHLTNSDFYTGAFPAEFGNAMAGAFDIKMRNGNNQKHEFMGQMGFNGFELGAEGPFSENSQSSYMANFRYSTLEVLHAAGMNFGTGAAIPEYKDLSFKVNIPLQRGRISVFGLGGNNRIAMLASKDDDSQYGFSGLDLYNRNRMGVLGMNHVYYLNDDARITHTLAVSGIESSADIFDLSLDPDKEKIIETLGEMKYTFSSKYSHRFNSRNFLNTGFVYDFFDVSYNGSQLDPAGEKYLHYLDNSGGMGFARLFTEWQHRFSDEFSINTGIHASRLFLNDSYAIEPRFGMKWEFTEGQSVNFGAGMHSQTQMKAVYFSQRLVDSLEMRYERTNEGLDFSRSLHLVAGYDRLLGEGHRLKAEIYYQRLYNIPVTWRRPEFSLMNQGGGYMFLAYDNMENSGSGENKGVELTIEKFLNKGFYYLFTASVFDSGYRGYDGIWRNSAFNNNFVFNALAGYEWQVGENSLLSVDLKMVYAGGHRKLPVDVQQSLADNALRYNWSESYEERFPDYFRLNGRITFRLNRKSFDHEWGLDLQNITNRENIFVQNWDSTKQEVATYYQMGFMPMMTYRIYF